MQAQYIEWIRCPVCGGKTRIADTERYGTKKFSPLLSEMQTGKFD